MVKSLYKKLHYHLPINSFQWIWNLQLPQKLKQVIWLMSHHRLPTSSYLHNIHISQNANCPICHFHEEIISHIFFQCHNTQILWHQLSINLLDANLHRFHDNTSHKFSQFVLKTNSNITQIPPHILIPYALWHL